MYICCINRNFFIICLLFDVILVVNYNEKILNELDNVVDKLYDCIKKIIINVFSY